MQNGLFSSVSMVLEATRQMMIRPDVIHANDWQTGIIPALVET